MLTFGERDDEFCQSLVADEEAGGDDGEAGVLAVGGKFAEFLLVSRSLRSRLAS